MKLTIISLRCHGAAYTQTWLRSLAGTGTAYLTDRLYKWLPEGGREWMYPGGRDQWEELPRPGDLETAVEAAAAGADLLYRFPSMKRRRVFVRWPERRLQAYVHVPLPWSRPRKEPPHNAGGARQGKARTHHS